MKDQTLKMDKKDACGQCGHPVLSKTDSLKHHWVSCESCGSTTARKKSKYPTENPIFRSFILSLFYISGCRAKFLRSDYLPEKNDKETGHIKYSQYAEYLKNNVNLEQWEDNVSFEINRLTGAGFDLEGKRILVLSGGPGLLAKELAKKNEVVITEYSASTVEAMRDILGLNAVQYDLNNDKLEQVVSGKFDIVIALSVVNFCEDLRSFAVSLAKVLQPNAKVCMSNDDYSLGYALTWQFEDYIPTNFPSQKFFLATLGNERPIIKTTFDENVYNAFRYRVSIGGWKNKICYLFRTPFWIYYSAKALLSANATSRSFDSRNVIHYLFFGSEVSDK